MDDGVVVMVDGRAKVLQRTCRRDDGLLLGLLRTRPDLVLGAASPGDRRRLLLVTDSDVPPLQRVYVDSEAVPLLVGVQATGHDQADGDVLLRLLDRVALELPPWRHGRLRELAAATHGDRDEAELLIRALDWREDPDTFWARVESNVARDRVRIVLVADRVPDELTRIVEFLDGQLRDVEVRRGGGVALRRGPGLRPGPQEHETRLGGIPGAAREAATRPDGPGCPGRPRPGRAWPAPAPGLTPTGSGRLSHRPLAHPVDPLAQHVRARDCGGRATALLAQRGMGDAVGLAGAVVPRGDQAVELAAQHRELLVGGELGHVGVGAGRLLRAAVALALGEELAHLVGLEEPGDAEEVHLLLGADVHLALVAELGAVEEHPVEVGLGAERLERLVEQLGGGAARRPARAGRSRRRRCRPRR